MTELTDRLDELAVQDLQDKHNQIKEILKDERNKSTLQNVYDTISSRLKIKDIDKNRIDITLATALSNQLPGTPIWLFLVGASGDWKTTLVSSLEGLPNVKKVDQMTANTLASGKPDVPDLGSELVNKSSILIFLDLASLTSANKEEKAAIWGQFRSLYDGDIYKRTGAGINKAYSNCHVTIIACTTQAIRDEILIHAQLGTRELLYDTEANPEDNDEKMEKAWENEEYEREMKEEFTNIITNFIKWHPIKKIVIPEEIKQFCKKEANRLTILRASGAVDHNNRELINPVCPEVPTRLIKQLKRIYIALKSLDENYSDEKAKQIISHIVDSTGDKVRQMILNFLQNHFDSWYKIPDLQFNLKLGRNSIKTQLETLWNLNIIEKKVEQERIGGYYDDIDHVLKGGRIEEVAYYRFITTTNESL